MTRIQKIYLFFLLGVVCIIYSPKASARYMPSHVGSSVRGVITERVGLSKGIQLDTTGSIIVGGKRCAVQKKYGDIQAPGEANVNHFVMCEDGTSFNDVIEREGSAMEGPSDDMRNDYIGSYLKEVISDKPGTQRRMMYFDSDTQVRNK